MNIGNQNNKDFIENKNIHEKVKRIFNLKSGDMFFIGNCKYLVIKPYTYETSTLTLIKRPNFLFSIKEMIFDAKTFYVHRGYETKCVEYIGTYQEERQKFENMFNSVVSEEFDGYIEM